MSWTLNLSKDHLEPTLPRVIPVTPWSNCCPAIRRHPKSSSLPKAVCSRCLDPGNKSSYGSEHLSAERWADLDSLKLAVRFRDSEVQGRVRGHPRVGSRSLLPPLQAVGDFRGCQLIRTCGRGLYFDNTWVTFDTNAGDHLNSLGSLLSRSINSIHTGICRPSPGLEAFYKLRDE